MTLPVPNLDDLRFQRDLVDEARKRIIHYCPEWTEYNLSDPGITLIELFAWMTELMVYRLNRVPEKNYIKFLEMLGLKRMPASSARTELTFWLSVQLGYEPDNRQTVTVPQGFEVRSDQTDEEILFTTLNRLDIVAPQLAHIRKEGEFNRNFFPRMGLETFNAFSQAPRIGDTFYLGFDASSDISGHIVQLAFTCSPTEAVGIRREDPPWIWECLMPNGNWRELKLSELEGEKDTTGGLNNEQGMLTLYLPLGCAPESLYNINAFWLRCRVERRNALQGMYTESPRIRRIEAFTIGATTPSMHSTNVDVEPLGASNGEPAQAFMLRNAPVLSLQDGETLEVEETQGGESLYVPWQVVKDFSKSTRFDRHYILDNATGGIFFGPAVRQPDGTVIQYGRVPESGRNIRFSQYRHGGGVRGNLPERSLTTTTTSLAYVARVSNLIRATGGRDQETMDELKLRAQRELQAQHRAVTAQDYEQFTMNFSRSVARAKCLTPTDSTPNGSSSISVLVVPAAAADLRVGGLAALHMDDGLQAGIRGHLDQYRLLTTPLAVREPSYFGVQVNARVVPQDFNQPAEVALRVSDELRRFLNPLRIDDKQPIILPDKSWEGWQFGRDLFVAEVISLIQQVPSVKFVLDVQVSYRSVVPVEENSIFEDNEPRTLYPVDKVLRIPPDGLICSLEHKIEITSIEAAYQ